MSCHPPYKTLLLAKTPALHRSGLGATRLLADQLLGRPIQEPDRGRCPPHKPLYTGQDSFQQGNQIKGRDQGATDLVKQAHIAVATYQSFLYLLASGNLLLGRIEESRVLNRYS